jgi:hypothetical protein
MRLREYLTIVFLGDQLGLAGTVCCYAGQEEPAVRRHKSPQVNRMAVSSNAGWKWSPELKPKDPTGCRRWSPSHRVSSNNCANADAGVRKGLGRFTETIFLCEKPETCVLDSAMNRYLFELLRRIEEGARRLASTITDAGDKPVREIALVHVELKEIENALDVFKTEVATTAVAVVATFEAIAASLSLPKVGSVSLIFSCLYYSRHAELSIMLQKFARLNSGSSSAITSSFIVPNVVSGL